MIHVMHACWLNVFLNCDDRCLVHVYCAGAYKMQGAQGCHATCVCHLHDAVGALMLLDACHCCAHGLIAYHALPWKGLHHFHSFCDQDCGNARPQRLHQPEKLQRQASPNMSTCDCTTSS